jgi:arginyl-tRNA synthetase
MVVRDPIRFFSDQTCQAIVRSLGALSEESWHEVQAEAVPSGVRLRGAGKDAEITLEVPPAGMGDFAFPCFQLATFFGAPPNNVAFQLFPHVTSPPDLSPPVLAGPYINFNILDGRLVEETLRSALSLGTAYGQLEARRQRVILEHTSANATGPLHVGRARNPIIGDSLGRVMRLAGYEVTTQYYLNDLGRQAVLVYYGVRRPHGDAPGKAAPDAPGSAKPDHRVVALYQAANKAAEEDPAVDGEVARIMADIERGDAALLADVRSVAFEALEGIRSSLARLGILHDEVVPESQFVVDGSVRTVVERLSESEHRVDEEDGAVALELEPFGIHGRSTRFVFLRKDGTTLYTTRDLAYHLWKAGRADLLVNVLGEDHKLEARQLGIALGLLGCKVPVEPVFYAFVSLPEGKMSTREGRTVFLDDLMDEAVVRARADTRSRRPELDDGTVERIAQAVGLGAVRYNIVRMQPEKAMVFRWEDALSVEGSSAPFVQYAHTRACSILAKAAAEGAPLDMGVDPRAAGALLTHPAELTLVRWVARLPGVIEECAADRKVHTLAAYAEGLSSAFSAFYRDVPVLQGGGSWGARLLLVEAARITIAAVLGALGIAAPEQM